MLIQPISNQNFKAKVHMDLMVQKAYKTSKNLRDAVELLKQVKCDEVYLVRKQRGQSCCGSIMGQSVHADGRLDEAVLGYYEYDSVKDTYHVGIGNKEISEEDMLNDYNWKLYYRKHNDEGMI